MTKNGTLNPEFLRLSRVIALLLNRSTMYNIDHPYVLQAIDGFCLEIMPLLKTVSPIVLVMIRDQLFIDELPFDRGVNVQRIVAHLKKAGIQSISFESALSRTEVRTFLEIFTAVETHPNAESMKKALAVRGVRNLRINHVLFKKVTEDDEVVSREALKQLVPETEDEERGKSKKLLVEMVFESLLGEELRETITMENLLKNPAGLSQAMTEADLESSRRGDVQGGHPGLLLEQQIDMLGHELGKSLSETGSADLPSVAQALFEMKKRLMEGIETHKSLNISYPNEEKILDKVNDITDGVVLRIIRDEYKGRKTSTSRMAQIVRRLIPDIKELKRLLPKIRAVLIEEGLPLAEYMIFIQALGNELQGEELASILQESSEEIGVDAETLMQEIRKDPAQATELILLASEIRKGAGDEHALVELLVDYVERLGSKLTADHYQQDESAGDEHLRRIVSSIESNIVGRLKKADVKSDLLERLEERFNKRMDEILERVKLDWLRSQSPPQERAVHKETSVLRLLEQSVDEGEELAEILETIRAKVQAEEMDENDFGQIYAEISRQQASRAEEKKRKLPRGVLDEHGLKLILEKEIARAKRYGIPFSTLSFSLVRVAPASAGASRKISLQHLLTAIFEMISTITREPDIVGELCRNKFVVLLPMTGTGNAQSALTRCLRLLHGTQLDVDGTSLKVRVAGVVTNYDLITTPNVEAFMEKLTNQLAQMERRIRNLQTYF